MPMHRVALNSQLEPSIQMHDHHLYLAVFYAHAMLVDIRNHALWDENTLQLICQSVCLSDKPLAIWACGRSRAARVHQQPPQQLLQQLLGQLQLHTLVLQAAPQWKVGADGLCRDVCPRQADALA